MLPPPILITLRHAELLIFHDISFFRRLLSRLIVSRCDAAAFRRHFHFRYFATLRYALFSPLRRWFRHCHYFHTYAIRHAIFAIYLLPFITPLIAIRCLYCHWRFRHYIHFAITLAIRLFIDATPMLRLLLPLFRWLSRHYLRYFAITPLATPFSISLLFSIFALSLLDFHYAIISRFDDDVMMLMAALIIDAITPPCHCWCYWLLIIGVFWYISSSLDFLAYFLPPLSLFRRYLRHAFCRFRWCHCLLIFHIFAVIIRFRFLMIIWCHFASIDIYAIIHYYTLRPLGWHCRCFWLAISRLLPRFTPPPFYYADYAIDAADAAAIDYHCFRHYFLRLIAAFLHFSPFLSWYALMSCYAATPTIFIRWFLIIFTPYLSFYYCHYWCRAFTFDYIFITFTPLFFHDAAFFADDYFIDWHRYRIIGHYADDIAFIFADIIYILFVAFAYLLSAGHYLFIYWAAYIIFAYAYFIVRLLRLDADISGCHCYFIDFSAIYFRQIALQLAEMNIACQMLSLIDTPPFSSPSFAALFTPAFITAWCHT